jgi:REP element-mobilizing transposase RayT
MDCRYGSHTVFQIEYHFVWVTKYRYKVLSGEVAERVRELVRQTCEVFEIRIVRGVVRGIGGIGNRDFKRPFSPRGRVVLGS